MLKFKPNEVIIFMKHLLLILCVIGASAFSPAFASGPGEKGGDGNRGPLAGLRMTDEQKSKMKALREAHKTEMKGKREEMKKAREAFHELMRGSASDAELRSSFEKLQSLKTTLA